MQTMPVLPPETAVATMQDDEPLVDRPRRQAALLDESCAVRIDALGSDRPNARSPNSGSRAFATTPL